jgi:hypothetical protein
LSDPFSDPEFVAGLRPIPSGLEGAQVVWGAADLEGVTPEGEPVRISLDGMRAPLLLAFLATRCDGCETFWNGLGPAGPLPARGEVHVIVLTKGPASVDAAEVRRLAGSLGAVPVVMSDAPWAEYRVTGYPFFVLVDPAARRIVREAVAFGMEDVLALLDGGTEASGLGE